jgi:chromosome segregation ATPase
MPNAQMVALLQQLMAITGAHTGSAIKTAIDNLLNTHDLDIQELQDKVQVLQNILDADPSTPEFDQAQNIITSLNDIISRVAALEGQVTTLNADDSVAGSVDYKVAQERQRAQAAEQANAQCCADNASEIAAAKSRLDANEADIDALETRADATDTAITAIENNIDSIESDIDALSSQTGDALSDIQSEVADLTTKQGNVVAAVGLDSDGNFVPEDPSSDATNIYEYIHDVSTEGTDRANTLRRQVRRLARRSRQADNALDARLDILEGDESVDGSVAKAVKGEKDRAEAAEAAITQSVADEAARAQAAEQSLQDQVDSLSGGGTGSIQSVRDEVDATQAGAGLESDGSYAADGTTNYLGDATSLKDADKKLDTEVKGLEDRKADRTEVVLSADIAAIDVSALGQVFLDALNCGLAGGTDCDQVNTGSGGGDGDGAVI